MLQLQSPIFDFLIVREFSKTFIVDCDKLLALPLTYRYRASEAGQDQQRLLTKESAFFLRVLDIVNRKHKTRKLLNFAWMYKYTIIFILKLTTTPQMLAKLYLWKVKSKKKNDVPKQILPLLWRLCDYESTNLYK